MFLDTKIVHFITFYEEHLIFCTSLMFCLAFVLVYHNTRLEILEKTFVIIICIQSMYVQMEWWHETSLCVNILLFLAYVVVQIFPPKIWEISIWTSNKKQMVIIKLLGKYIIVTILRIFIIILSKWMYMLMWFVMELNI